MFSKEKDHMSQISNESFKQLAKNNVKKSIKDYVVYFITLSFGVALLYSFNSIDNTLSNLMGNGMLDAYIYMSRGILGGFSIIICLVFGFLITYSNNFIMKKRKREFGIYTTLGMDKKDINKLMLKENTIIGFLSLCVGLILGIFASQGIGIITFKMINIDSLAFKFSISISAIIKTIFLFVFVLLLVNKFNKKNIDKYKLIDLINSNKKNENFTNDKGIKHVIIFIISIILIIGSYGILKSLIEPRTTIISVCIALILLGTYLFFISVSDFVLKQMKKRKKLYYDNLTMFTISQMSSRIKSMSLSITVICLVIFAALVTIPFGMGFADYLKQDLGVTTPFDATVTRYNNRIKDENVFNEDKVYSDDKALTTEAHNTLKDALVKGGFSYDELVSKSAEVKLYELNNITFNKLFNNTKDDYDYDIPIMGITDYNNIRKNQGLKEIDLKNNEFMLNVNGPKSKKLLAGLINNNMELKLNINNHKLKFSNIGSDIYYYNSNTVPNSITLIVPDQVLDNLNPTMTYLNVNYLKSNNEYDNKFSNELMSFRDKEGYDLNFESKLVIDGEKISLNVVFSFISIYLGIILLISAGAILALKQISESTVNKERFDTLRKIGVKEQDMKKSIFIQVLTLFSMPLILAILHSIFVSNLLYEVMLELSSVGLYKNICVSSAIVAVIYGSYFFASYYESLSIINNKKNR
ncbi:ABC transporter permease [Paraclostridium bifermentans]|uniref:FtsX-like permease family protein n=1 Tax=Paraclostridium bifermentans TaxID=1490 RepID=UPI00214A85D5|nr:ABC transporter permease [Paraclostridium bifermentans]MCR1876380.1 ABC transporter permease [Paraclostridium bifermentans]